MDKGIFICPNCKTVYISEKSSGNICSNCNMDLIATGIGEQDWYSHTYAEREEMKQKFCDGSITEKEITQQTQNDPYVQAVSNGWPREYYEVSDNSGWNSLLRGVAIINLVVTCIGALIIGIAVTTLLGGFTGLIIAAVLMLFAFVSTGAIMIFLDMSSDIRAIRRAVEKNK